MAQQPTPGTTAPTTSTGRGHGGGDPFAAGSSATVDVDLDAGLIASATDPRQALWRLAACKESGVDDENSDEPTVSRLGWLWNPADDGDGPVVCTPTELACLVAEAISGAGLAEVGVSGVVCGSRRRNGCVTFDLVEQHPGETAPAATVRCVLFGRDITRQDAVVEGMAARVWGDLRWDAPWGQLRVIGKRIEPLEERSSLAADRDALVAELTTSAALGRQAALVVSGRPLRVGIVTGAASAAAADLDALLAGSGVEWQPLRCSVPMAGPAAADAVAAALAASADEGPDVIVLARGGGGRGELSWADSATVAHTIAGCPVPVWTAIGHAHDTTVADLVANRAMATPSAAAAALVERVHRWEQDRHERVVLRRHAAEMAALARRARHARVAAVAVGVVLVVFVVLMIASH
ncbi:MAG: exodeoxyribonuclease VII large subunit [Acidimicrobiales bacterium]